MSYAVVKTRSALDLCCAALDFWDLKACHAASYFFDASGVLHPGFYLLCDRDALLKMGVAVYGDLNSLCKLRLPLRWNRVHEMVSGNDWRANDVLQHTLRCEFGARGWVELHFDHVSKCEM